LSLALGAFIAGIVISESAYSHQITASVLPFRDIFNSIFFISIGMLIRFDNLIVHWLPIIVITTLIILFKALVISLIFFSMRYAARVSFIVGFGLAQVGEFSFVLLKIGQDAAIINQFKYQILLSSTVITMILTPIMIRFAPVIALKLPDLTPKKWQKLEEVAVGTSSLINHVIIAGYGLMGQHLANVLKKTGIPYMVLDINNENVRRAKDDGHLAYYGDTSYPEVLRSVGITAAKVLVFCISDPVGTRRGIKIAKEVNADLHVIVRTKYMAEIASLLKLGANQVIPEEFETSVEIFSRVLKEYKVPGNIIQNQIDMVRLEGYSMLRGVSLPMEKLTRITSFLAASVSENFFVEENNPVINKSIKELDIRGNGGASIIAVVRGSKTRTNPPATYVINSGDILVLLGSHAEIDTAMTLLKGQREEEAPEATAHELS
ncbi:MAG: cation:proton antiporter, partial [Deltaproteobacteria bacterium]|nr:cation:proton antiporter [Deltaproteobacteria bacterium]